MLEQICKLVGEERYRLGQPPISLTDCIEQVINKRSTFYLDGRSQCLTCNRRSIVDVIRTTLYYYPDRLEEILQHIVTLFEEGKVYSFFCCDIKRQTIEPGNGKYSSETWIHNIKRSGCYVNDEDPIFQYLINKIPP